MLEEIRKLEIEVLGDSRIDAINADGRLFRGLRRS
jgi:hypothetical protein